MKSNRECVSLKCSWGEAGDDLQHWWLARGPQGKKPEHYFSKPPVLGSAYWKAMNQQKHTHTHTHAHTESRGLMRQTDCMLSCLCRGFMCYSIKMKHNGQSCLQSVWEAATCLYFSEYKCGHMCLLSYIYFTVYYIQYNNPVVNTLLYARTVWKSETLQLSLWSLQGRYQSLVLDDNLAVIMSYYNIIILLLFFFYWAAVQNLEIFSLHKTNKNADRETLEPESPVQFTSGVFDISGQGQFIWQRDGTGTSCYIYCIKLYWLLNWACRNIACSAFTNMSAAAAAWLTLACWIY